MIGVPHEGVTYTVGVDGYPAFAITQHAVIRRAASLYFKRPLFRDFAVGITLKPTAYGGGFVFSVVNPYQNIVQFGLSLTDSSDRSRQNLAVYYTPNSKYAEISQVIANFSIPSSVGRWTKLGVRVEGEEVTLFLNCREYEKALWRRGVAQLEFEPGSTVYIAQSGPHFEQQRFVVRISCLFVCLFVFVYLFFY